MKQKQLIISAGVIISLIFVSVIVFYMYYIPQQTGAGELHLRVYSERYGEYMEACSLYEWNTTISDWGLAVTVQLDDTGEYTYVADFTSGEHTLRIQIVYDNLNATFTFGREAIYWDAILPESV